MSKDNEKEKKSKKMNIIPMENKAYNERSSALNLTTTSANIESIDDYNLISIFKHLPLADRFRIERVCSR